MDAEAPRHGGEPWARRIQAFFMSLWTTLLGVLQEFRRSRLLDWRIINLIGLALLLPMVCIYIIAPIVLIVDEPTVTVNFGVLPWLSLLLVAYVIFLFFVVIGFIGALFRHINMFRSYLVTLIGLLVLTTVFFGQVLLLFSNAFQGGAYTLQGVDFTCGANETILILSTIDKLTGNPVELGGNSTIAGDYTAGQVSQQLCDQSRKTLIIVVLVIGVLLPLVCCGPCVYFGVKFFQELAAAKREVNIDLTLDPYGGDNDPATLELMMAARDDDNDDGMAAFEDGRTNSKTAAVK